LIWRRWRPLSTPAKIPQKNSWTGRAIGLVILLCLRVSFRPRPHPEEQAKPASRRMRPRSFPRRPRPSRLQLRWLLRVRAWVLANLLRAVLTRRFVSSPNCELAPSGLRRRVPVSDVRCIGLGVNSKPSHRTCHKLKCGRYSTRHNRKLSRRYYMELRSWLQQWLGIGDLHQQVAELDIRIGSIETHVASTLQHFGKYRGRTDEELALNAVAVRNNA